MNGQHIDPQLLADCHVLGTLTTGTVLLHRNATLHWFILVPETPAVDVLDMEPALLQGVIADSARLSAYLKASLDYPKVNLGALGNQVAQVHVHVIGRRPGDACWPNPVWGNLQQAQGYTDAQLQVLRSGLEKEVGLAPLPAEPGAS